MTTIMVSLSHFMFNLKNLFKSFGLCCCLKVVTQSCPTLCDPMNCNPPGSSVHGNLQARILEWVAIPFSRDVPNPGTEPKSAALQADSLLSEPTGKPQDSVFSLLMAKVQSLLQELRFCKTQEKKKRELNNRTNKFYI